KAKLSKIVKEVPSEKSVVITKKWSPLCGTFFRNGRNGSRKHVTYPAKRFLAIAGPRTQGGEKKGSPDSKIFRTDTHLHFIEFQPRRTLLLSRRDHVNVIVRFDLMQEIRPDPNATQLLTKNHGSIIGAKMRAKGWSPPAAEAAGVTPRRSDRGRSPRGYWLSAVAFRPAIRVDWSTR